MTTSRCFLFSLVVTFSALQTGTAGAACGQDGECPKDDVLLQLQGALKTSDVERHQHGVLQKTETQDDLPVARSLSEMQKYVVADRHKEAGAKHLEGPYGALTTKFAKMAADLTSYWARIIQKTGQSTGPHAIRTNYEQASRDRLREIMGEWRGELLNFGVCPEAPLDMEACLGLHRCLVEDEVGLSITSGAFATFMEVHDELENVIIRDFELEFQESKDTPDHGCESEHDGDDDMNHRSLLQVNQGAAARATATAALIQHASDSTVQALESQTRLETHDFQRIWSEPCAALGCNHSSWLDIMETVHGHTAELIEVGASARTIRVHVRSMRAAHRALKKAAFQSSALGENFEKILMQSGQNAAANKRYDLAMKEVGGMLDGAYMLMKGSKTALTWFNICFSTFAGGLKAYQKKFGGMPTTFMGAIVSFRSNGQISLAQLQWFLMGQPSGEIPAGAQVCANTCGYNYDGDCDDGGAASDYSECILGTDCSDCGERQEAAGLCDNACYWNYDGDCDDGGEGSSYSECEMGEDCDDCGPRTANACPFGNTGRMSVSFGLMIGFVGGDASAACIRAGISVRATFDFDGCGGFTASVTAAASGAIVWASGECENGTTLGPFTCAEGVTVGVGLICCNFNLVTGEEDC